MTQPNKTSPADPILYLTFVSNETVNTNQKLSYTSVSNDDPTKFATCFGALTHHLRPKCPLRDCCHFPPRILFTEADTNLSACVSSKSLKDATNHEIKETRSEQLKGQ